MERVGYFDDIVPSLACILTKQQGVRGGKYLLKTPGNAISETPNFKMSLDPLALENLCLWCEFQSNLLFLIQPTTYLNKNIWQLCTEKQKITTNPSPWQNLPLRAWAEDAVMHGSILLVTITPPPTPGQPRDKSSPLGLGVGNLLIYCCKRSCNGSGGGANKKISSLWFCEVCIISCTV